ncbi:MAG: hypothetical protein IIX15_03875 [Clostridia bacterium]|nr:hypothetical protein [Clostridia bacterium]
MRIEYEGEGGKLAFFKQLYEESKAASDEEYELLDRHLEQYRGSAKIDGSDVEAKMVRNITYELIESQVTGYIPNPSVSPKMWSERNERNARSVEVLLRNLRDDLPYEAMNDMDERYSPIYGGSIWLVEWDNSIVTHNTVGGVKLSCLSPKHFVGQPNIYNVSDMEYCFITFETTKEDIERRYGVRPEVAEEASSDEYADDHTATLYVCYYKNEEDKICQYIWSADTEILDIDDYYARKRSYCKVCGKREELCNCEKPKTYLVNEEFEEPIRDILCSDGSVIPAMSEVIRDGQIVMEEKQMMATEADGSPAFEMGADGIVTPLMTTVMVPKTEQTKLPFYQIDVFPIVIRKNTSQEDKLIGQSDCEFIRPQQQAINKIESRMMEKLIRAGVYPIVPEDCSVDLDNSVFETVFRAKPNTYNLYGRVDLQVDISRDIAQAERLYDQAKRILGITDSFQGQADSTAQSGKAKQLQIQQAAGRLDSKRQMKNAAYSELDLIIFRYYLAYADEPRPAVYKDAEGKLQNVIFNRYDFLERDEAGEWYYNDQYLFRADASMDVDKVRETLWQENRLNFQSGAYGDPAQPQSQLIFWQNMERAHYPWARDNVDRIRDQIAQQQQMAQYQQQIAQLQTEVEHRAGYENELLGKIAQLSGGVKA